MARLNPDQLDALRRIDSPTIANASEPFDLRPRIEGYGGSDVRGLSPDLPPLVGYAVTCTVDSTTDGRVGSGFNALYAALEAAPQPSVVVMQHDCADCRRSCCAGEIVATTMKRLGAVGLLTDGGVRDVVEVRVLGGFHYFCAGLVVSHGSLVCVSVGDAVTIAGMTVRPGDLLHGDANGVVMIPDACAAGVMAAADRLRVGESETLRRINHPDFDVGGGPELAHETFARRYFPRPCRVPRGRARTCECGERCILAPSKPGGY